MKFTKHFFLFSARFFIAIKCQINDDYEYKDTHTLAHKHTHTLRHGQNKDDADVDKI